MLLKRLLYCTSLTLFLFLAGSLEPTLFAALFGHFKPHLLLLLVIYASLYRTIPEGGFMSLLAGYFQDIFSGSPQGFYMLSFMLVFFTIKILSQAFYVPGKKLEVLSIFLGTLLATLYGLVILSIFTDHAAHFFVVFLRSALSALWNTLIGYFLFAGFHTFDLWVGKRDTKKVITGDARS
ncbi:MAG: rod shape-determining protein MreD [Deltaproteobacteria bacterium]|nr:rod shape-determining protein MreD [Deltaproteobacteria bacterium]